jgi:TonB family protein
MRNRKPLDAFALLCLLLSTSLCAQVSQESQDTSRPIKIYKPGKHIFSPELLAGDFSSLIDPTCQGTVADDAQYAMIIDPMGQPRNIIATGPAKGGLASLAAEIAAGDRFSVGQKGDASVAVSITVNIHLEGCVSSESNANHRRYALAKPPLQTVGPASNLEPGSLRIPAVSNQSAQSQNGLITAPVAIFDPEASYSPEAKRKKIQGVCLVSMVVDVNGIPQNLRVIKPLGYGLDESAMDAVKTYRFKPATKGGQPVPVMMTVQVNFRLK